MANPNIVEVVNIRGNTSVLAVTTSPTALVSNAGSSNKVVKINALYISNIDGVSSADVTVDLFRGGVAYHLARTIAVPPDATLDLVSKAIYLIEGDSIRLTASANSDLEAICSYEEIS